MDEVREQVRARYAAAATAAGGCCGSGPEPSPDAVLPLEERGRFGASRYDTALAGLPVTAVATSLGCGDPTSVADLHPGEVVLDLGSGAGLDVLLSARRVGPTGHAYGLDMTEEMLTLARTNAAEAGARNVTFLAGEIEAIPLPDAAVDVVVSNCVINLSTDKDAVFRELSRVVRPGGRLAISDVVAEDHLSPEQRAQRGSFVGCIAGALSFGEYRTALAAAGFTDVEVVPTHEVANGLHAAVVRGVRRPG
jgi:arsenite methyltransferase